MFGYIKPFKPELKICEFEAYRSVYCGLCGQLGKSYGALARMTLSYDFTFLSMLYISLSREAVTASKCRCHVNPFKKTPCIKDSAALRFGADIAAIMLYYKLIDNISDSGAKKIIWLPLKLIASPSRKKAAAARPEADEIIAALMKRQSEVEAAKTDSLDEAASPTAEAMSKLCGMLGENECDRRILSQMGYFIGRFVYICDALDDIESDLKRGGYNPLILRFQLNNNSESGQIGAAREYAKESLYMTIGEVVKAYDLLVLSDFKPVLDNIVTLGLRAGVDELYSKKGKGAAK